VCRDRDLDAVTRQRVPDPVPGHAVDTVALVEVLREEPDPVLDATVLEVVGHDGRVWMLEHPEAAADGVEDDCLDPLRRDAVGRDERMGEAEPRPFVY